MWLTRESAHSSDYSLAPPSSRLQPFRPSHSRLGQAKLQPFRPSDRTVITGYSRLGQAKLQPFRPSNMTVITGYSRLGQAKLQPFRPSTTKIFRFSGYSTINDFQQVSTKIQSKLKLSSDAVEAKYYNHAIFGTKLVTPSRSSTIAF